METKLNKLGMEIIQNRKESVHLAPHGIARYLVNQNKLPAAFAVCN